MEAGPCNLKKWKIEFWNLNLQISKLHGPASILKYQENVKLRQKQFHMKDMGKSSSRKFRYVIYSTLYRMDPQKTHYKISFFANISKNKNWGKNVYIPPQLPINRPLRAAAMLYSP